VVRITNSLDQLKKLINNYKNFSMIKNKLINIFLQTIKQPICIAIRNNKFILYF